MSQRNGDDMGTAISLMCRLVAQDVSLLKE